MHLILLFAQKTKTMYKKKKKGKVGGERKEIRGKH